MLKNITLSADEELIRQARDKAKRQHTTLNATFRRWLRQYVNQNTRTSDFYSFMESLDYVKSGRKFSREELNDR
jgi:hypothetical protein